MLERPSLQGIVWWMKRPSSKDNNLFELAGEDRVKNVLRCTAGNPRLLPHLCMYKRPTVGAFEGFWAK